MAFDLNDPEFWLPPQFLSDDPVTDFNKTHSLSSESNSGFPVQGSSTTETESDEDEFLTEFTRRLTNSTLLSHVIWKPNYGLTCDKTKSWKMATSPQSTLTPNKDSGRFLYASKFEQEDSSSGYLHFLASPPQNPFIKNHRYNSNQPISHHQQQKGFVKNMQQGEQNKRPPTSAWPTLQQPPQTDTWTSRAVVIGSNITKRVCSGTGVFLPRPAVIVATPPPKKPAAWKQLGHAQHRQDIARSHAPMMMINNQVRLPQEWIY